MTETILTITITLPDPKPPAPDGTDKKISVTSLRPGHNINIFIFLSNMLIDFHTFMQYDNNQNVIQ